MGTNGRIVDEQPFHPAIIVGVESAARKLNLKVSISTLDFSDRTTLRRRVSELCGDRAGGIILIATEMVDDEDYSLFEESEAPIVMVDGWSDKLPFECVVTANESAAYRACAYLAERGHERIGYLGGNFRIKNFPLRERGWRKALSDVSLDYHPEFRRLIGTTFETALSDLDAWLDEGPELPTAFFCDNDMAALAAIHSLTAHGISVPRDVSIVGFDDIEAACITQPPLTTVHVPRHGMGQLAVQRIMAQEQGDAGFGSITQLHTMLVERDSVCQP